MHLPVPKRVPFIAHLLTPQRFSRRQIPLAIFDYFPNWEAQFHLLWLWLSHRVPFWRSTTNDPRGFDNSNEPQYEANPTERYAGVDDIAVASRSFMMDDFSFPGIAPTFYV